MVDIQKFVTSWSDIHHETLTSKKLPVTCALHLCKTTQIIQCKIQQQRTTLFTLILLASLSFLWISELPKYYAITYFLFQVKILHLKKSIAS